MNDKNGAATFQICRRTSDNLAHLCETIPMFKNCLVSVSDKSGLVEFLKPWAAKGLRIVSTGGTAKHLSDHGIKVIDISEQTGFPEVMDGRVKTLHPRVHMALLARDGNEEDAKLLKKEGLDPFDLVIVNLYPFEAALQKDLSDEEQIEFIDIGGPSMLRAAAKNFSRLTIVCDPKDYQRLTPEHDVTEELRRELAGKVFQHTSSYDAMIAKHLLGPQMTEDYGIGGALVQTLRYGENPHQKAAWYRLKGEAHGLFEAEILQGKELSYNNILDLEAAIQTLREFPNNAACVAVKHNNPCGVALGKTTLEAVKKATEADPISVFGGIIAVNKTIDTAEAEILSKIFLECVVAPDFSQDALKIFAAKKNVRLLRYPHFQTPSTHFQLRSVSGGFLLQTSDQVAQKLSTDWKIVGEKPSAAVQEDLMMAWKVCAHLKSNAIAIISKGQTVGLGMGQVNRVDSVAQAIERTVKFHPNSTDRVLASDAFFPFPDSIELIAKAGVRYIIQPGGAMRDEEVLKRAQELQITTILTGQRHFFH